MKNQNTLKKQSKSPLVINDDFDISEWISIKAKRRPSNDPSKITWTIEPHPKKDNEVLVKVSFGKEILVLLDNSEEPRIMPLVHKDDNMRILLIKSANGYRLASPQKSNNYYFFKFSIPGNISEKYKSSSDPIFHAKGRNSSSIIEFNIHEAFEDE